MISVFNSVVIRVFLRILISWSWLLGRLHMPFLVILVSLCLTFSNTFVFVLSTDDRWHQFSANRNPQFGVGRRRKLYAVQVVIRHDCENSMAMEQLWVQVALGASPSPARQFSAPGWPVLLSSRETTHLCCFCQPRET